MALFATKNLGILFLAVWLIITGLLGVATIPIPSVVMAVLALLAGVLLLLGR